MKKYTILFLLLLSSFIYSQSWNFQTWIPNSGFNGSCAISTDVCWLCGPVSTVCKTTNGGTTWLNAKGNLPNQDVSSIYAINALHAWIGTWNGSIYYTTDGGVSWTLSALTPPCLFIDVVHMFDANNGFALGDPVSSQWRYYITTNGGVTYTLGSNVPSAGTSSEAGWANAYWAIDTGHIGWGTNNSRIYHGGWKGPITYTTIAASNQFGFAIENNFTGYALCLSSTPSQLPLEKTTDCGLNWIISSYNPPSISYTIKNAPTIGTFEYWIGGNQGIYYSSNGGVNWSTQFTVTGIIYTISMVSVQCGWAGSSTGDILKYTSPHPIGIINKQNQKPESFSLSQNYPNPFNPTTNVKYQIAKSGNVKIIVYDFLGKEVTVLVNEYKPAGYYEVEFNASNLASGLYFYELKSGTFSETRKMILMK